MSAQLTAEQVEAALELDGVAFTMLDRFHLDADAWLVATVDGGRTVLIPRARWAPARTCTGRAECVAETHCPRRTHRCTE